VISIEALLAYKSANGKIRTASRDSKFAVADELKDGSLITVFNEDGEVLDQRILKGKSVEEGLEYYVGPLKIVESEYKEVEVKAVCPRCGKRSIRRELDLVDTRKLSNVPVVPIYVCTSCGQGFYSLTKEYLKKIVDEHLDLFSAEENSEREKNEEAFINELNEYIIRIFASKKLMRIKIEK
jgi:predicted RNA-binding Zn-ribbon protein involved in translation (DUF1610 family)